MTGNTRIFLASAAILFTSVAAQPVLAQAFDDTQKKAIETIVREYLLANPEILVDVSAELQKRNEAKLAERRKPILKSLFAKETPYSVGKGDVTIVEFFDYNCPVCRSAFEDIAKLMETDKNVRVVFVDMPIFQDSPPIIQASLASAKQGKYFEYHRAMLAHKGRLTEVEALRIAKEVGLDVDRLKTDMNSPEIQAAMRENLKIAEDLGVNGTPAFFIGDDDIAGAPEDAQQLIDMVNATRKNGCGVCGDEKKS
ncbi:MAG: DsbA family protein [Chitinophagales bacterium]|nr:DsbA family protein [Hyphomicrobiales bacterium]